jgi:hypothetical protein
MGGAYKRFLIFGSHPKKLVACKQFWAEMRRVPKKSSFFATAHLTFFPFAEKAAHTVEARV